MSAAATRIDAVVIGAGVLGLAVARALVRTASSRWREVLVLERNDTVGAETTSRNSEVVHGGLYYPTHSYKAQWCVNGRQQLYEYCQQRNIAVNHCGKLVVATTVTTDESNDDAQQQQQQQQQQQASHQQLQALHHQALSNGVTDVELLDASQVRALEPNLSPDCTMALWSPSTGVVDSHALLEHLWADVQDGRQSHGQGGGGATTIDATLALRSCVNSASIHPTTGRVQLRVGSDNDDNDNDCCWLDCDTVVNCAGLWADQIARHIHTGRTAWQPPKQYYCKGTYFKLDGQQHPKPYFQHLIYPLPDPRGGLGIHATLSATTRSDIKFGPDVEWLPVDQDPDFLDYRPDPRRADAFYDNIRRYWPDLTDGALIPDYAGARPKLWHPEVKSASASSAFYDFCVAGPSIHRVPGLVHLFGMESPGLTASLAVADCVVQELQRSAQ